jgi:hypothetical protein
MIMDHYRKVLFIRKEWEDDIPKLLEFFNGVSASMSSIGMHKQIRKWVASRIFFGAM